MLATTETQSFEGRPDGLGNKERSAKLEEAVGSHHLPQGATRNPLLSFVVHIADVAVNALQLGSRGGHSTPRLAAWAWARLGIPSTVLFPAVEKMELRYRSILEALEINQPA